MFELAQMFIGAYPGVLQDVLRFSIAHDDRSDGAKEALIVPPHQQLIKLRLAPANAADHFVVGNRPALLEDHNPIESPLPDPLQGTRLQDPTGSSATNPRAVALLWWR